MTSRLEHLATRFAGHPEIKTSCTSPSSAVMTIPTRGRIPTPIA